MSDGSGTFEIAEADGVSPGTKIIVHLKKDCSEFADETVVRDVIKKYSSFVGCPVNLNGAKSNELRPVWLMDPKEVTPELHEDFYRCEFCIRPLQYWLQYAYCPLNPYLRNYRAAWNIGP